MKIADAQINMQSTHLYKEQHTKKESLRMWEGDSRPDFSPPRPEENSTEPARDTVTFSSKAQSQENFTQRTSLLTEIASNPDVPNEDPKLTTIRLIIESLTGRKMNIANISEFKAESSETRQSEIGSTPETPERQGWGVEYNSYESYFESEETNFSSSGTIHTQDGKSLDFAITLSMEREFFEENSMQIRMGDAQLIDPLVINYAGNAAQLTDLKFSFDLNSDGIQEEISHVRNGSGFLFIDKNRDGEVTNGSELFGPTSGSGFAELAAYDLDNNGWIDENDPVFTDLQIWSKEKADSDYFSSLSEKNIGAIYLDSLSTTFSLKDQENTTHGQVQNSSIFLRENGQAGTIQEIKL